MVRVIADTWKWTGYHTVIFLAGLQTIPNELYEAAEVDGTSLLQRIVHITLPSIRSITLINTAIALMGAFSVFDPGLCHHGRRSYNSSEVLLTYMYLRTSRSRSSGSGRQWSLCFSLSSYSFVVAAALHEE